jgi:hypothetical protein
MEERQTQEQEELRAAKLKAHIERQEAMAAQRAQWDAAKKKRNEQGNKDEL